MDSYKYIITIRPLDNDIWKRYLSMTDKDQIDEVKYDILYCLQSLGLDVKIEYIKNCGLEERTSSGVS